MKAAFKKKITLDRFINEALYKKNSGFYMKKNPIGKMGDFITAPNISVLFSEMIAVWIISFWKYLNCPKKINLIELGGGNGEMVYQMLKAFNNFPVFKNSCKIYIFEKSPLLIRCQKQKLRKYKIIWLKDLNKIKKYPSIYLANEFFDSLPIKQFVKKKIWFERYVKFNNQKFKYIDFKTNIKKVEKKINFNISKDQNFIEFSPLAFQYLKIISKQIRSGPGGLLILDYGYIKNAMKNTIQAISKHQKTDVLKTFGDADITYQINFKLIKKIANTLKLKCSKIITQSEFLTNLGIQKRAEILSKNLPFSKKANIYYRMKRLIDKNQMGKLFKVIFITNNKIMFKEGFKAD